MAATFVLAGVLSAFCLICYMQYHELALQKMDLIIYGVTFFFTGIFFLIVIRASIRTWKEYTNPSSSKEEYIPPLIRFAALISPLSSLAGIGFGIWAGPNIYKDMRVSWHEDAYNLCKDSKEHSTEECFTEAMECLRILYKKEVAYSDPKRDLELASCMKHRKNPLNK